MKKNIIWTLIIIIFGGIALFFSINKSPAPTTNNTAQTPPATQKTFSINDVAKHNDQISCWTVVGGNVYDITNFILSHPAGVDKIMRGCGVDATNMFNRVGAHSISIISNSIIGLLK